MCAWCVLSVLRLTNGMSHEKKIIITFALIRLFIYHFLSISFLTYFFSFFEFVFVGIHVYNLSIFKDHSPLPSKSIIKIGRRLLQELNVNEKICVEI